MSDDILKQNTLRIRQKFWQLIGKTFYLSKQNGSSLGVATQDALKLKPTLQVYANQYPLQPWLTIKPKHLIQTNAHYEIIDAQTNKHLATLRFKGIRSFWLVQTNQLGTAR